MIKYTLIINVHILPKAQTFLIYLSRCTICISTFIRQALFAEGY